MIELKTFKTVHVYLHLMMVVTVDVDENRQLVIFRNNNWFIRFHITCDTPGSINKIDLRIVIRPNQN